MSKPSLKSYAQLSGLAASDVRAAIRQQHWQSATAGLAPGFVQVNLVVLPEKEASEFHRFCLKNPKPCPLLAMSEVGDPTLPSLGQNIDIRTDLPRYRVFEHGKVIDQPNDITQYWRDDLVAFAIGCSFTFEHSLIEYGIGVRHIEQDIECPLYRTTIQTGQAGRFHGAMVVSMRPMKAADAIRAIQITSRFPGVHGAPVHIGDPALIGIKDITQPDYGNAVSIGADELPVFWACGVTPQAVVEESKPAFCISHFPNHMLVTDKRNTDYSVL